MFPAKILMCEPKYFEVNYEGNEFMKENLNSVDKDLALLQWNALKDLYQKLGFEVELIEPAQGLVDMVFTANQSFPFMDSSGNKKVILSKMKNQQRKREVEYFKAFFLKRDYEVIELPEEVKYFESMGDAIIDYHRNIIFSGHGFRTQETISGFLSNYTNFKVVKLHLINQYLYHLDTCLSILNSDSVIIAESAFDEESLRLIKHNFENVINVGEIENLKYFLCNCHCPDGKNVIVQRGGNAFKESISRRGFNLIEVETSEFIKSGGSVFCMKLMFY